MSEWATREGVVGSPRTFKQRQCEFDILPPKYALDADFDDDRARCHQVTLENWQKRGVFQRIKEYLSRILKPQA